MSLVVKGKFWNTKAWNTKIFLQNSRYRHKERGNTESNVKESKL